MSRWLPPCSHRRMRTGLFLILLGAACVSNAAPGGGRSGDHCGAVPRSFDKDVQRATRARDASYAAALANKKLAPYAGKLVVHTHDENEPTGALKPNQIEIGHGELYAPPTIELVADPSGKVYRVQRRPMGNHKTYVQCGCGPVGGGAMPEMVSYVGDLPSGVTYAGFVEIAYEDTIPVTYFDNQQGGRPCPMPP